MFFLSHRNTCVIFWEIRHGHGLRFYSICNIPNLTDSLSWNQHQCTLSWAPPPPTKWHKAQKSQKARMMPLTGTHKHTHQPLSLTQARTHIHTNSLSLTLTQARTHIHTNSLMNSVKWLKWCEKAVVNQTNTGTVSKAPLGNLRRDGVECVYMDFPQRLDAILNWTGLTCTVHAHTIPSQNIHDNDVAGAPHSKPCFLAPFLQTLTGYAAEGALFILAQLSTEIVPTGFMLSALHKTVKSFECQAT